MKSPVNIKTAEVLEGDNLWGRAFALFLRPHPGEFGHFFQTMLMPGGWPGGGGHGHCWN